jgi:hypothetical protein
LLLKVGGIVVAAGNKDHLIDYGTLAVDVDESKAVRLAGGDVGVESVSGIWGYRADFGNWHGELNYRLNWGVISPSSLVFVAAGEGMAGGPSAGKFIGAARFSVYNVAPAAGYVYARINIEWGYPIRLYVDYLVVNP